MEECQLYKKAFDHYNMTTQEIEDDYVYDQEAFTRTASILHDGVGTSDYNNFTYLYVYPTMQIQQYITVGNELYGVSFRNEYDDTVSDKYKCWIYVYKIENYSVTVLSRYKIYETSSNYPYPFNQYDKCIDSLTVGVLGNYLEIKVLYTYELIRNNLSYNLVNGTWTVNTNISSLPVTSGFDISNISRCAIGNRVYYFGCNSNYKGVKYTQGYSLYSLSDTPFYTKQCLCYYDGQKINIFGGMTSVTVDSTSYSTASRERWQYDIENGTWTKVEDIPYDIGKTSRMSQCCYYNGDIYVSDGYYKLNGRWRKTADLYSGTTNQIISSNMICFNNDVYYSTTYSNHSGSQHNYGYNSSAQSTQTFYMKPPVSITTSFFAKQLNDDEIHIFSSYNDHYIYSISNTEWTKSYDLPSSAGASNSVLVMYRDRVHLIGQQHYIYDSDTWVEQTDEGYSSTVGKVFVDNDKIYKVTSTGYYCYDGTSWSFVDAIYNSMRSNLTMLQMDLYYTYQDGYFFSSPGAAGINPRKFKVNDGSYETLVDFPNHTTAFSSNALFGRLLIVNGMLLMLSISMPSGNYNYVPMGLNIQNRIYNYSNKLKKWITSVMSSSTVVKTLKTTENGVDYINFLNGYSWQRYKIRKGGLLDD